MISNEDLINALVELFEAWIRPHVQLPTRSLPVQDLELMANKFYALHIYACEVAAISPHDLVQFWSLSKEEKKEPVKPIWDKEVFKSNKSLYRKLKCFLGFHKVIYKMEECDPVVADMLIGMHYFRHTEEGKCLYCAFRQKGKKDEALRRK